MPTASCVARWTAKATGRTKHDAAGELIETVGYSKATNPSLRTRRGATFAEENATETQSDLQNDIHSYTLQRQAGGRGVDGELFDRILYDLAGNKTRPSAGATAQLYPGHCRDPSGAKCAGPSFRPYTALNQLASYTNPALPPSTAMTRWATLPDGEGRTPPTCVLNAQYDKRGSPRSSPATHGLTGNPDPGPDRCDLGGQCDQTYLRRGRQAHQHHRCQRQQDPVLLRRRRAAHPHDQCAR